MPALNLPGLTTSALPTAAAASSPAAATRDIGQTTAEPSAAAGTVNTADTPAASFGQHLRHARGKASAGGRTQDTEREVAPRSAGGSARRALDVSSGEAALGSWPSTIQTASMTGGRWTSRDASAVAMAHSPDPRAKALLEAALLKTAAKDAVANGIPAATTEPSGPSSNLDLKSITSLLAGADGEAGLARAAQGPMALSMAEAEAIADSTPAGLGSGTATALSTGDGAAGTAGTGEPPVSLADGDDVPDPQACVDARHALAANLLASTKSKATDDRMAPSAAMDDAEPGESTLARETAASDDEKPTQAADGQPDPSLLQAQATSLTTPQPLLATSSAVTGTLESSASGTSAAQLDPSNTAPGTSPIAADTNALAAANHAALPAEFEARPTAAAADAEPDQVQTETDESATSATAQPSTSHVTGAAASSQPAQPATSTAPAAAVPVAQPTVPADASVARVQDLTSATPQASVTPVYDGTIDPAIDTAAFAPALGARIAVLARDGIEQARLNVHPADMGPISVQLSLDGTQVRVDFSADMAGTRQTLEEAMPSLAASLRDAGFTLSGGGVSQHSAQNGRSSDSNATANNADSGTRGNAAADDSGNTGVNTTPNRSGREAGLVDLFA